MTTYTATITQDARKALAEAIAKVADDEKVLVTEEYALDPINDASLIALIAEGKRLKREAGRVKRLRDKINAQVREGLEATNHTILVIDDEPAVELLTGVQESDIDWDLLERLAPVALSKARTITHTGTRLTYK